MASNDRNFPRVVVDERQFVYVDGVKVCRIDKGRSVLRFYDKNKLRSAERGSDCVEIPLAEFALGLEVKGGSGGCNES